MTSPRQDDDILQEALDLARSRSPEIARRLETVMNTPGQLDHRQEDGLDYTAMDGPTMLSACRDDAAKWAAAFCQHAKALGHKDIDEGWMIGWFASAIEQSHAVRTTPASRDGAEGAGGASVCQTCNGTRLVGGFVNADSGHQDDPCPDCTPPKPAPDALRTLLADLRPFVLFMMHGSIEERREAVRRIDAALYSAPRNSIDDMLAAERNEWRADLHRRAAERDLERRTIELKSGKIMQSPALSSTPPSETALPAGAAEAVDQAARTTKAIRQSMEFSAEDAEYANDLMVDLAEAMSDPATQLEIVQQWFRKIRAETLLAASPPLRGGREAIAQATREEAERVYENADEGSAWDAMHKVYFDAILSLQSGAGEGEKR